MLWIGSQDFQISALAETQQSVVRAAARMNAAERGAHAGLFFDKSNAFGQIATADDEVIKQSGNPDSDEFGSCDRPHCREKKISVQIGFHCMPVRARPRRVTR